MTTAPQAYGVLRTLIEANKPAAVTQLCWQNEDAALPNKPATFVYTEFRAVQASVIEIGGGRGANRHRNGAELDLFVFVPRGEGMTNAGGTGCLDLAETFAALLRPYNANGVLVEAVTVYPGGQGSALKPPGFRSEIDNYFFASVGASLRFDLRG
jgi:hypothetical protein